MAIEVNSKTITIPLFRVGEPEYTQESFRDTIQACMKAAQANKPEEDKK